MSPSRLGQRSAEEARGRVSEDSLLLAVNQYDFAPQNLGFREVVQGPVRGYKLINDSQKVTVFSAFVRLVFSPTLFNRSSRRTLFIQYDSQSQRISRRDPRRAQTFLDALRSKGLELRVVSNEVRGEDGEDLATNVEAMFLESGADAKQEFSQAHQRFLSSMVRRRNDKNDRSRVSVPPAQHSRNLPALPWRWVLRLSAGVVTADAGTIAADLSEAGSAASKSCSGPPNCIGSSPGPTSSGSWLSSAAQGAACITRATASECSWQPRSDERPKQCHMRHACAASG
ncbi:uncharacterized protein IUM83_02903 [Phytophthora cinnamomi]|uniref:uncharacterized protein n=1 Tax=Phytophthora cinnamomi TaxID=4785 RepID=UPI00355A7886|nr:hypothetical protein IUM83_02903 [Phytophthora cinnamomi]